MGKHVRSPYVLAHYLGYGVQMARIGILVVAYNAESTLERVIDRIPADIRAKVEEIFVFDDASKDRTFAVGQKLQQEYTGGAQRSEEHTSELQSRQYLVCRLLLEKK